jgi:hypothetical protein
MKKLFLLLSLIICLTGCVSYDVGIKFPQANQGTITQQIKLSEQLSNVSEKEGRAWLKSIEKKAGTLQGKSKYLSADEILVTIPFNNAQDLVNKFNQFFLTKEKNANYLVTDENLNLLDLSAKLSINQNNALFLERNNLKLIADLTSLGLTSADGNIIFSSGDLINLQVKLDFPLGAKIITNEFAEWEKLPTNEYNIKLQAGQINEIQAIFWIPNYVGLGSLGIILFIIFGFYVKYRRLPLTNN